MRAQSTLACLALPLMLTLSGCNSLAPKPEAPKPLPSLDLTYSPPSSAKPGSAGVVFAIVAPQWASDSEDAAGRQVLGDFKESLKTQFVKVVLARGFTTRGDVYSSRDDLLYGDKTNSDLVLTPEVDIQFKFEDLQPDGVDLPVLGYFTVDGSAVVQGRVVLNAYETLTNEKLWTKPIMLDPIHVTWTGESHYDTLMRDQPNRWVALALRDTGFRRAIIPQLNAMFENVMKTSWNYLDPQEFASVKAQADALKKKATVQVK